MIKRAQFTALLAVVMLLWIACVKNDPVPQRNGTVGVNVVNAIPTEVVNFYINGTRQNNVSGIAPLTATGVLTIPGGVQTALFKRLFDINNFNNADTLFTLPLNLKLLPSGMRYTLFAAGVTQSDAFTVVDTIKTDSANAMVKFVSASKSASAVSVFMNDTLRFTSKAYKTVTVYKPVGNGNKVVKVYNAANALVATTTINIGADSVFTLFSAGNNNSVSIGLLRTQ